MKPIATALIGFTIAAFASTASAHVVEITTSIPTVHASSDADLKAALEAAVDDAVKQAIRFTPTMLTLQDVRRIGDRIYLTFLVVDHDGEELMKQLATDEANDSDEPSTEPAADAVRSL